MPTKSDTTPVKATRKTAVKKAVVKTAVKKASTVPTEDTAQIKAKTVKKSQTTSQVGKFVFTTGRRKTAVANVKVYDAEGDLTVNGQPAKQYFSAPFLLEKATLPMRLTGRGGSLLITAFVSGGGQVSQADSLSLAISKALVEMDESTRLILKKNGLLTRDSRKKERKKPGLKRARRAPQWAKR